MSICPECGYTAADAAKFCPMCGTPIPSDVIEEPSTEPAKPAAVPEAEESVAVPEAPEEPNVVPEAPAQTVYAAPVGAKPKKKKKKWWIALIVLGALLTFALFAALGYGAYRFVTNSLNGPDLGLYTGVSATMDGTEMDIAEVLPGGFTVELKSMGKCVVTSGRNRGTGIWTLEDGVLTINDGVNIIKGTLKDGTMHLSDVMGSGVSVLLMRDAEGYKIPVAAAPEEDVVIDSGWWSGDWFGWWTLSSGDGYFDGWDGSAWNCCAEIEVDESGSGHLLLWDEDTTKSDPLMEFDITVTGGSGEMGAAVNGDGWFMDMDMEPGELTIDPDSIGVDDLIYLEGWYDNGDDSFYYEMYLRPWGNRWEDLAAEDEGWLPFYFDRYLSALDNGEPMPEDFQTEWAEAIAAYEAEFAEETEE